MLWLFTTAWAAETTLEVRRTTEPIVIDGRLDESAWAQADVVDDFNRYQPVPGGPPASDTQVRVLQDDKNLYFAIEVRNSDRRVRARVSPREDINADDQIGIYLDPFQDRQGGYIFYFNALGIQQDIRVVAGTYNFYWNTVVKSKGVSRRDGYVLEIAFPWRSLKFPTTEGPQTWGVIVTQKVPAKGEKYSWPNTQRGHPRVFAQAAPLLQVDPPPRGSGVEIIPSVTVSQSAARPDPSELLQAQGFDPLLDVVRPSLDVRLGVTPNFGMDLSLNPDFSQVESDETPIDINPRFAFYFNERRRFFLEGRGFIDDPGQVVYTRSIVDPLFGTKVTGKQNGWSIGALHALDRQPVATVNENGTPGFDDLTDRWATNTALRLRRDAFGNGYLGLVWGDKRVEGAVNDVFGADLYVPMGERWGISATSQQSLVSTEELSWGQENLASVKRSSGVGTGISMTMLDRTQGLRKEMGFLTQSGLSAGGLVADHTFAVSDVITTLVPFVDAETQVERNGDFYRTAKAGTRWLFRGIHELEISGNLRTDQEQEVTQDGWGFMGDATFEPGRLVAFSPAISFSRALDYVQLLQADRLRADLTATLRPTPGIRLEPTFRQERLQAQGQGVVNAQIARIKLNTQFTRELGLRIISETTWGNARDTRLLNSALITYLLNPDTAFYLSYAENAQEDWTALERAVFLKGSVLLRP